MSQNVMLSPENVMLNLFQHPCLRLAGNKISVAIKMGV
jgi:hypothetical protein